MRISKIHLIGMQLQETAATIKEAKERMSQTCDICSKRGISVQCRHCVVLESHRRALDAFEALEALEEIKDRRTYVIKGIITLDMQLKMEEKDKDTGLP